jgi:hypothetical protein
MECPDCSQSMDFGSFKIHGSIGGFLIFGLSEEQLYFQKEGEKKEKRILEDNNTRPGFRCPNCKTIIVRDVSSPMDR